MTRQDVYHLIDGERDYQDNLGIDRNDPSELTHSVGDYLTMIDIYLRRAQNALINKQGIVATLDAIRTIGGIVVHCMEEHGAPPRG
jgi:hypothetical protein